MDANDPDSQRVFSDMHTGIWIQRAMILVGPKGTPIGLIIYSDKTHALQGVQVYPLYCKPVISSL